MCLVTKNSGHFSGNKKLFLNRLYFPNETTKFDKLSDSVWLPSLITCYQSLESFRSPEVINFIHKNIPPSFPMCSKVSEWAIIWHFDVIMSGALQAKSLGWFRSIPDLFQCNWCSPVSTEGPFVTLVQRQWGYFVCDILLHCSINPALCMG